MKFKYTCYIVGIAFVISSAARSIPDNVQAFYASVQGAASCIGDDLLKGGFYDLDNGNTEYGYCQKGVKGTAIYIKGPGSKLANMDIDCDGEQSGLDPRCQASTDTQGQTAFQSEVQQYGISDLKADVHPYVVLGNEGNYSPTFDPRTVGVSPLSVVAVVCNNQLIYAIWGDVNGDDGKPLVGEASLAVGTACFGQTVSGNNGHDDENVLYIAFSGSEAVPGSAAKWNASNYEEFESSLTALGDSLVAKLPSSVTTTTAIATATVTSKAPHRAYSTGATWTMILSLTIFGICDQFVS